MAQLFKFGSYQLLNNSKTLALNARSAVTFQFESKKVPNPNFTHDEHNMKLGRPLSPHLTIYRFPLPSMLSITHRFTGLALSGYTIGLSVAALLHQKPIITCIDAIQINSPTLMLVKFCIALPFTYHFFNGIRHLIWDFGKFLTLKGVYSTGYTMLAVSTAAALFLTIM